jgi:hypothetical protein
MSIQNNSSTPSINYRKYDLTPPEAERNVLIKDREEKVTIIAPHNGTTLSRLRLRLFNLKF